VRLLCGAALTRFIGAVGEQADSGRAEAVRRLGRKTGRTWPKGLRAGMSQWYARCCSTYWRTMSTGGPSQVAAKYDGDQSVPFQ
jgi:hypothetical protein